MIAPGVWLADEGAEVGVSGMSDGSMGMSREV
jgi:hypothetical protein